MRMLHGRAAKSAPLVIMDEASYCGPVRLVRIACVHILIADMTGALITYTHGVVRQ